jgi:hypothetical protein
MFSELPFVVVEDEQRVLVLRHLEHGPQVAALLTDHVLHAFDDDARWRSSVAAQQVA